MTQKKSIHQRGKRFSLGLALLCVFLTYLLCSLSLQLLRDIRDLPGPDRQAIEESYRRQLAGGDPIWQQAQSEIQSAIDAESREALLRDATPLAFDGKRLYLGIPDDTDRDALERRHRKNLEDALRRATGQEIELSLRAYHGWIWTDPLEVRNTVVGEKLRETETRLAELTAEMSQIEYELSSARTTLETLLEVQNAKSAAGQPLSTEERTQLERQQTVVLEKEKARQEHQRQIIQIQNEKNNSEKEIKNINITIADRDTRAQTAYEDAFRIHSFKIFALQFLVVAVLLFAAAHILLRKRQSRYIIIYAAFVVTAVYVFAWFLNEYVPARILEYLVRAVGVAVLLALMIAAIKRVHRLSGDRLMKQIRQALLAKRCPNCGFPFYEGRASYEVLGLQNKRILKHIASGPVQVVKTADAPHNFCQNCGMTLVDKCKECGTEKYALLPYCPKCNAETDVVGAYEACLENRTE